MLIRLSRLVKLGYHLPICLTFCNLLKPIYHPSTYQPQFNIIFEDNP